jgi:hypothetical protein
MDLRDLCAFSPPRHETRARGARSKDVGKHEGINPRAFFQFLTYGLWKSVVPRLPNNFFTKSTARYGHGLPKGRQKVGNSKIRSLTKPYTLDRRLS